MMPGGSASGWFGDRVSRLVRIGLFAASALCLAGALYLFASGKWLKLSALGFNLLIVGALAVSAVCALAATRLSNGRLRILVAELCLLGVAVYAVEYSLALFFPANTDRAGKRAELARELGIPFDDRPIAKVVRDLRGRGEQAYPSFPVAWAGLREEFRKHLGQRIFPLSNVANAEIVECNESGKHLIWQSDEHGFHNPKGLYGRRPVQIVAIGSSFVIGQCVPSDRNMIARLREGFPNTLNFGMTYTTSLTNLGIFREFVEPLKPRVVLWFIYNDDFFVKDEIDHEILKRYLEPDFRQDLWHRQEEADRLLGPALLEVYENDDRWRNIQQAENRATRLWWRNALLLTQLRARFVPSLLADLEPGADIGVTLKVLRLVKRTVAGWGGRLYAVYIPDYIESVKRQPLRNYRFQDIAPLIERENIPLIDGYTPVVRHPDPASLYTMRFTSHFNPEGYRLMADVILRRLRADMGKKL